MLRYSINYLRHFCENDVRFLKRFQSNFNLPRGK